MAAGISRGGLGVCVGRQISRLAMPETAAAGSPSGAIFGLQKCTRGKFLANGMAGFSAASLRYRDGLRIHEIDRSTDEVEVPSHGKINPFNRRNKTVV